MAIQNTSIDAFISIQKDLGKRQRLVLEAIRNLGVASNFEISEYLHIPINQVTPRTNELFRQSRIEENGKTINQYTNRLQMTWRIRNEIS